MALKDLETGKYYKVISVDVFTGYTIIYVYKNEKDRRNSERRLIFKILSYCIMCLMPYHVISTLN